MKGRPSLEGQEEIVKKTIAMTPPTGGGARKMHGKAKSECQNEKKNNTEDVKESHRILSCRRRHLLRSGHAGDFISLDLSAYEVGTRWHSRCCLLRDRGAALFLSCATETETTLLPLWKTPGFPPKIRLPRTTNMISVPEPR